MCQSVAVPEHQRRRDRASSYVNCALTSKITRPEGQETCRTRNGNKVDTLRSTPPQEIHLGNTVEARLCFLGSRVEQRRSVDGTGVAEDQLGTDAALLLRTFHLPSNNSVAGHGFAKLGVYLGFPCVRPFMLRMISDWTTQGELLLPSCPYVLRASRDTATDMVEKSLLSFVCKELPKQ